MSSATVFANDVGAQTIDIAAKGDVVFVVGTDRRRLKVYSIFVMTASPVFNAMLGPNFMEGHRLIRSGQTEVELPEDNADAMEIVLNVIHGRNDRVQRTLSPGEVLKVAVISDKYDCSTSLAFAIRTWLDDYTSTTDPGEMWILAMAALALSKQDEFAKMTSALVFHHAGSYLGFIKEDDGKPSLEVQLKTAVLLEEARNSLRMKLVKDVLQSDWDCSSTSKKKHKAKWPSAFANLAENFGQTAISSILEALEQGKEETPLDIWSGSDPVEMDSIFRSISHNCRAQHEKNGGLCLWCVRTETAHDVHTYLADNS
ncbi:hypothetical protein B0I35DRAFT_401473 [Stachybotrys elegans]|uniref:BTB domain-containing protein n=1 Tax=Stachybotrys elegans TaxID=80388 RepID=A0A8K0WJL9_9HYPO|nr:hypothetical protein B0I35DRAFT_401473 [Stachybotrys elegans]